jgi:hypothetical protein
VPAAQKLHTIEPHVAPHITSFVHVVCAFATPLQPSNPTTLTANARAIALHFNFMGISLGKKVFRRRTLPLGASRAATLAIKITRGRHTSHRDSQIIGKASQT